MNFGVFLGFLALIHVFLCLLGKRDAEKSVYMLICVSNCQIMKIKFFFPFPVMCTSVLAN